MKKKVFALIIAVALVVSLAACKGTTDRSSSKDSSSSTTAEVEKDSASNQSDKDSGKETDNNSSDKETSTDKSNEKSDKETGSSSSSSSSKSDNKVSSSTSSSKTSNSSNSSSKKPSGGSNSPSSSSNKPSAGSGNSGSSNKPSTGGGSSSSGNSGSANKPHQHNYSTVVSSTNGDCSHKGKVTKKCSCGATITVDGNYGSHNWKDSYKEVYHEAVTKPVYAYCYVCNKCGAQFNDEQTCGEHCIFDCGGSYSYKEWIDHYETVTPAWTEKVPNGKDCTICGKHSN